jgi:nitrate reductase NapAB chaperone NapD
MSFATSVVASAISALSSSLPVHLVFHTDPKKKDQRRKIMRTTGPRNWSFSSYPSTYETHLQAVTDNVSKMNWCTVKLRNMTVVVVIVVELRKTTPFQHV